MLRNLLFCFLPAFFLPLSLTGQETGQDAHKKVRNEIGINLYNIIPVKREALSGIMHIHFDSPILNQHFFNGIMFKRHWNNMAVRAGADYFFSKNVFENVLHNGRPKAKFEHSWENKIGEMRVGFEYKFTNTRFQPFIATDFTYAHGRINGKLRTRRGEFEYPASSYKIILNEVGVSPAFGVKYLLNNHFSVAAESSVNFMYFHNKDLLNGDVASTGLSLSSWMFYINFLRLFSVNYHF